MRSMMTKHEKLSATHQFSVLNRIYRFLLGYSLSISIGCGPLPEGAFISLNESPPAGRIIAQGSFKGMNEQEISGNVYIYHDTSQSLHTFRLEGFNAPKESGLMIEVLANTVSSQGVTSVLRTSLKGHAGNQNYSISQTGIQSFSTVKILSSQKAEPSNLYGTAMLDAI
jgi:hypothetical protein